MELSTVIDLVRSLYRGNFLEQRHVDVPSMVTRAMDPVTDRRLKARQFGKTLSIEWEGAHRLVQWIYDHGLKWVFKPLVLLVLVATAVVGLGAFVDILRHEQFVIAGRSLAIGFVVLIVLDYVMVFCHELGHALVIVHNGRRISSAGFQIYFGSPAFFVESSDGLMMDRRKQIAESFAGPFARARARRHRVAHRVGVPGVDPVGDDVQVRGPELPGRDHEPDPAARARRLLHPRRPDRGPGPARTLARVHASRPVPQAPDPRALLQAGRRVWPCTASSVSLSRSSRSTRRTTTGRPCSATW